jgi:hypothetical protein
MDTNTTYRFEYRNGLRISHGFATAAAAIKAAQIRADSLRYPSTVTVYEWNRAADGSNNRGEAIFNA